MTIKSAARTIIAFSITSVSLLCGAQRPFSVMPENAAKQITEYLCSREGVASVDGGWKLDAAIVSRLERDLKQISKLKSKDGMIGVRIRHPESYFRQYFGIIVAGRKLVFINAFAEEGGNPPSFWQDQLVSICDGGFGSWGVLYDPTEGTFSDLRTNGIG